MIKKLKLKFIMAMKTFKERKSMKIKEQEQIIYALRHQVKSLLEQRQYLNAQVEMKDGALKSAEMYISYLAKLACVGNEITIPSKELAKFKDGYSVGVNYDEDTKDFTICIFEKDIVPVESNTDKSSKD